MNKFQMKVAGVATSLVALTGSAFAQDISNFGQGLTGVTTSNSACEGVYEVTIPFCREECGQDRGFLAERRGALMQALNAADANNDNRVAIDLLGTARRDETQPRRFMNGRNAFVERNARQLSGISSVDKDTGFTTGEPYVRVRAADTRRQLQQCTR